MPPDAQERTDIALVKEVYLKAKTAKVKLKSNGAVFIVELNLLDVWPPPKEGDPVPEGQDLVSREVKIQGGSSIGFILA